MRLLLTGAWSDAKDHIPDLESMGHKVIFAQDESGPLPCAEDWPEGVVCNGLFLRHEIEKFTNLNYIQLTSAGFDRVPMDYIKAHAIEIHNAKGVYSIPMAEFAVGGVLQLYKQSRFFCENQRRRRWEKHRGLLELHGKTILIVGCGSVGTECAKRFAAFACNVVGVDLYPRKDLSYTAIYPLERLDELLASADITVLTLPLTEETRGLMNAERFARMRTGAVLVNIARGAVVDSAALLAALQSGRLAGAALDVFEEEPLQPDSPLWEMQNVVLTPHNSFVGDGNGERLCETVMENLKNAGK